MKKFLSMIKYVFFPFLMANAGGVDVQSIIGPNQTVSATVETENAFWLATGNGIYKISKNTNHVIHLTAENSELPSNKVNDICVTPNGNLYAATDKGILRYDGYAYMVINNENSNLPDTKITAVVSDKQNNLWIGTEGHGLVLMHNYNCRFFSTANSVLSQNSVESITAETNGTVFVTLQNQDLVKITDSGMKLISEPVADKNATAGAN